MIETSTDTVRLTNGSLELAISTQFGPRVVGFSFTNEPNALAELGDLGIDLADGRSYILHGGHRLWAAPELPDVTYEPDNEPVVIEHESDRITATQPAGQNVPIGKSIEVSLQNGFVRIVHTLANRGPEPLDIAPWAITQLPPGGTAIIPLGQHSADPHRLQPNASIVLWPYSEAEDDAFLIEKRLVILDATRTTPTKIGTRLDRGWLAYVNDGLVFVKRASHLDDERYFDLDASGQVYSGPDFIELETLGPRALLAPGATASHTETWELHKVDRNTPPHKIPALLDLDGGTAR